MRALGPEPDPDDVDHVIGNGTWTSSRCDECGQEPRDVVELGDPPEYESNTAKVCRPCLVRALGMFGDQ